MGMGDHIMCNGMVRHFADENKIVYLFCLHKNYDEISYMYRDNTRIVILPVENDDGAWSIICADEKIKENTIVVGHHGDPKKNVQPLYFYLHRGKRLDRAFYDMAEVPLEFKRSKFIFVRDYERENLLYHTLNPNELPFIFIHEDPHRGFFLDRDKIRKDLLIVKPIPGFHIFDYIGLLEDSIEIHIMESSFQCLIDSYQTIKKPNLFLHKYVRNHPDFMFPEISNNYEIVR